TVVFDKTGTLTLEQPHVKQLFCCFTFSEDEVLQFAATAETKQSHPIAQAILKETSQRQLAFLPLEEADYKIGFGIQVKLNGQTIRVGSRRFMTQESITIPSNIQVEQDRCYEYGHSLVMVALDDVLIGAIELEPTIRPEVPHIIRQLKARGLKMAIISGDHDAPTRHLAERLGINHYFAEVLPAEKANLVEQLENQGRKICFVGDGINDAIALKK
ncbi:MAG: HAD-IC family P-type ATPase, partial [Planctomycetes bacterium]|nr:HAD-IC family P-type ATPase [Planctomycetota bacterium]